MANIKSFLRLDDKKKKNFSLREETAYLNDEIERLLTFIKQGDVRGRRLALETTALMSPPMHRRHAFKGVSLDFRRKTRVSRRAGVIDSCLLTVREEGKCRFNSGERSEFYKKESAHANSLVQKYDISSILKKLAIFASNIA